MPTTGYYMVQLLVAVLRTFQPVTLPDFPHHLPRCHTGVRGGSCRRRREGVRWCERGRKEKEKEEKEKEKEEEEEAKKWYFS